MIETIVSNTTPQDQAYVEVPYAYGTLRVSGDEVVMQDMYQQAKTEQRQAAVEALGRPFKALGGIMVEGAKNFAHNVAEEMKISTHDLVHGTHYGAIRRELIRQRQEERFQRSIGLIAVRK